ncbi:MAG: radical SAM protein [Candidatus Eisenbacteria bacterium]|nr:radical SAM protein [Candidatus Eisenbacteria bacterium]
MYGMKMLDRSLSLFPDLEPPRDARPSGDAGGRGRGRRASHGRTQYRPLDCRSVLNENRSARLPFRWSINPYRGCEFGCTYCFARSTHRYLGHDDPASFERRIYVKYQAPEVLLATIASTARRGGTIAIGTVTDPYQPAEARFGITRRMLDLLARCPGLSLTITTRSCLIWRDLSLLGRIALQSRLRIQISMITLNPRLSRILEPRAPSPQQRLDTIRALSEGGLDVGLGVMPILPGITDSPDEMATLLRAAKKAGARSACCDTLRLSSSSWASFGPVVRSHFPWLAKDYTRLLEGKSARDDRHIRLPIMELDGHKAL